MAWTEERVQLLMELCNAGRSVVEIAEKLEVTRNAIIGKLYRIEMSRRKKLAANEKNMAEPKPAIQTDTAKIQENPEVKRPVDKQQDASSSMSEPADENLKAGSRAGERDEADKSANAVPTALPAEETNVSAGPTANVCKTEMSALKLSLLELTEKTCKWPIGDPSTDEFWFCGLPSASGKPYCEVHIGLAFQPLTPRRDRRARR